MGQTPVFCRTRHHLCLNLHEMAKNIGVGTTLHSVKWWRLNLLLGTSGITAGRGSRWRSCSGCSPTTGPPRNGSSQGIWKDGRRCGRVRRRPHLHLPGTRRCRTGAATCRKYFSVKFGTVMEQSKISYQNWAIATYLFATSLKGVSSMKLHRDLGVTQKTAWFMVQRLWEAWKDMAGVNKMEGPVEVDEVYLGGPGKEQACGQAAGQPGRYHRQDRRGRHKRQGDQQDQRLPGARNDQGVSWELY